MEISEIDRRLADQAREKQRLGRKVPRDEQRALRRVHRAVDEESRRRAYAAVPKKDWKTWSGRQYKTLSEQATTYGIPIAGKTIDLPAVVRWLHDFLAENARRLATVEGEDPMAGPTSPALERWREEKYRLARLERMEREQLLLPRDLVHQGLTRMAAIFRRLGDTMQRLHGRAAHQLVDEALDDCQREIDDLFSDDDRHAAADGSDA